MNNRIKEISDQCTTLTRFSYEGTGGGYNTEHFDKEKFAELIVKECVGLFAENPTESIRGQLADAQARDIIKEYFGVE